MTLVSASASKGLEAVSSLPLAEEGIATLRPRPVKMQGSPSTEPKMQSRIFDDQSRVHLPSCIAGSLACGCEILRQEQNDSKEYFNCVLSNTWYSCRTLHLHVTEYSTVFGWKCHDLSRIPTKERKVITQEQIHQAIQEKIKSANQSASNTPTKLIPPEDLIPGEFSRDTQRHSESKSPLSPSDTSEISPQPVQLDLTPDSQLLLKPVRVMDEPLGSLLTSSSLQAKSSNRYSEATGDMMMALAEQLKDLGNDHGYVGEEEANAQLLEDMVKELL